MKSNAVTLPPLSEQPASGSFADAKAALTQLRRGGRASDGTFTAGNLGALKTGEHCDRLLEEPALAAFHRDRVDAITKDLGGAAGLSTSSAQLVAELARVQLFTEALGENVMQHGALTGRGKTRAAVNVYLTLLERQVKLAQMLGLDRKQKELNTPQSPAEWLRNQSVTTKETTT